MKRLLQFSVLLFVVTLSCHKFEHDNVFDPASDGYSPPAEKIIMLEDFDDGNHFNLWGHRHNVFEYAGGDIDSSFVLDGPPFTLSGKGYVLKLKFSVTGSSSVVGWQTFLNDFDSGTFFSHRILGIKNVSFWIRGEKSGEKIDIVFGDSSDIHAGALFTEISTQWKKVSFPLEQFKYPGFTDSQLKYIQFSFYFGMDPAIGTIYLDNIAFER